MEWFHVEEGLELKMNYLVLYSIDIEADSPEEAAKLAHELIAHPDEASLYTYTVCIPENAEVGPEVGEFTFNMQDQLTDVSGNLLHQRTEEDLGE
jgi:hypothetical protein